MKLLASLLTAAALAAPVFSAYAAGDAPKAAKPDLVKGEASYTAVCAACHRAVGRGHEEHFVLGGFQGGQTRFRQGQEPGLPGGAHLPWRHRRPPDRCLRWLPQPQWRRHPCPVPPPVGSAR